MYITSVFQVQNLLFGGNIFIALKRRIKLSLKHPQFVSQTNRRKAPTFLSPVAFKKKVQHQNICDKGRLH